MFETSMLIGQSFVAGTETPERVLNPKTEEVLHDLPEASLQQVDGAVTAAEKAFKTWAVTTPAERSALLLKLADAIERESRIVCDARGAQLRQAAPQGAAGRNAGDCRLLSLFRWRGARHAWCGGRRVPGRAHVNGPARSHWGRRVDRAMELSAHDGGMEACACTCGGKHGRPEAL